MAFREFVPGHRYILVVAKCECRERLRELIYFSNLIEERRASCEEE